MTTPKRKTPGRPAKEPGGTRRRNVTIRMSDGLYERVVASASEERSSLSDEIASRLDRAYQKEQTLSEMDALVRGQIEAEFGGTAGLKTAKVLADFISYVEGQTGNSWTRDPATNHQVIEEITGFLLRYGAPFTQPDDGSPWSWASASLPQDAGALTKLLAANAPFTEPEPKGD
jgi:hypothetical protein